MLRSQEDADLAARKWQRLVVKLLQSEMLTSEGLLLPTVDIWRDATTSVRITGERQAYTIVGNKK